MVIVGGTKGAFARRMYSGLSENILSEEDRGGSPYLPQYLNPLTDGGGRKPSDESDRTPDG